MSYVILKYVHTIAATLSASGFLLRGYWMLVRSDLLQHRVTRIVPHVVDAILLLAGIAMLWTLHMNPLAQEWLLAKFGGLIAYILLGMVALKRGPTRRIRAVAFAAAVAAFAYIVGVALFKSARSWLAVW